jgi:hypothetical protein
MRALPESKKKLRFAKLVLQNRLIRLSLQLLYSCNCRCGLCDFLKPA